MNRPIKFRAFVNGKLYAQEYCGGFCYFIHGESDTLSLEDVFTLAKRGKCLLHQWTGLLDKNNREIYEGDIISFDVYEPHDQALDHITNAEVFWDSEYLNWSFGRFENKMYSPPYKYSYEMTSGIKKDSFLVTGNIFENPLDKLNPQVNIKPAS